MSQQEPYEQASNSISSHYTLAWKSLSANWRVLLIAHGVNFLLVLLAVRPFNKLVSATVGNSYFHDRVAGPFSYTLLTDFINNHGEAIRASLSMIITMILPFLLWSVFCNGGYMRLSKDHSQSAPLTEFWKGGAMYFFRFLRLSIYLFIVLAMLGSVCFVIFSAGGLNPMTLDSENGLIRKFYIASTLFGLLYFLVSIYKELAKAQISIHSEQRLIHKSLLKSVGRIFTFQSLLLGLLNLLVLVLVGLLYFGLKKLFGGVVIATIIVSQLFLVFRMATRYVKQASFAYQENSQVSKV